MVKTRILAEYVEAATYETRAFAGFALPSSGWYHYNRKGRNGLSGNQTVYCASGHPP